MHHQVLQGIDPQLDLEQIFAHWPAIVQGLAEPPRQRIPQIARLSRVHTEQVNAYGASLRTYRSLGIG